MRKRDKKEKREQAERQKEQAEHQTKTLVAALTKQHKLLKKLGTQSEAIVAPAIAVAPAPAQPPLNPQAPPYQPPRINYTPPAPPYPQPQSYSQPTAYAQPPPAPYPAPNPYPGPTHPTPGQPGQYPLMGHGGPQRILCQEECARCHSTGHWARDCPLRTIQETTGADKRTG